jgi:3-deoxy-D-arabino-heptulosonate 7-phosphate (DAHP) synthase class II
MNEERLQTYHQSKTPLNLVGSIHSQSLSRNSSIHNWPERNSNFVRLSDAFAKG